MRLSGRRVLIIVQNLPVPLDRRVWMECLALRSAGFQVSVICPKGPGDPRRQVIDGVRIYKYAPPAGGNGILGYLWEFIYCWIRTALLSIVVARREGFDAIQACNPPDTYWLLARFWRLAAKKFVYDQHDLNPEVFLSRFGEPKGIGGRVQLGGLRWLESMTYRSADHVISTNESYRSVALGRGRRTPDSVTVVRSGPDTSVMRPVQPLAELRGGRRYLAVYLGIMGPQDGVDQALQAFSRLVHDLGRSDCHFALLGFGDCLEELKELSIELKLTEYVTFTGRVGLPEIADYLSSADIGICPDPKSPLNDVSTMNKTMEYMAYCVPIVSFDLVETRVSAADSAVYVAPGDIDGFAGEWQRLLDDRDERIRLGRLARRRVSTELDWAPQGEKYVGVWSRLLGVAPVDRIGEDRPVPEAPGGRHFVSLDDEVALASFIGDRGRPDSSS
jgi:glycosyltransferase involved in cell wall biosynthesis